MSNLSFLSKLLERIAASHLLSHMDKHHLHLAFQSAYKQHHSVETAILRVQADVLKAVDKKKLVLLILLDLSAAFDTIDHAILIALLKSLIGVDGKALEWFKSYLAARKQSVLIDDKASDPWDLVFGVPQGPVLGPILFIIYTSPLGKLLESLNVPFHFYADDSQIYLSCDIEDVNDSVSILEKVINIIRTWMTQHFLCLNDDKTEYVVIGSKHMHSRISVPTINIGDISVNPSVSARNIGFIFEKSMSCDKQISAACRSAWFHLRNIAKVRPYLDHASTERLIHAFITAKLDCFNSLYYGSPTCMLQRLQRVQNAAARLVTRSSKYSQITPILSDLHWLPVSYRITVKILLMTFKAINGTAPTYIQDMVKLKCNSSRSMRSNDKTLLVTPKVRTETWGARSFYYAAPFLWNQLPTDLGNVPLYLLLSRV